MESYSINTVWLQEAAGLSERVGLFLWIVGFVFLVDLFKQKYNTPVTKGKAQWQTKINYFKNSHKWLKTSLILFKTK